MDDELEDYWKAIRPRLKGGRHCKARLVGQVFGRLTVISQEGTDKHGATLWKCLCACGKEKVIPRGSLKSGRVKSCGCLLEEYQREPKGHLLDRSEFKRQRQAIRAREEIKAREDQLLYDRLDAIAADGFSGGDDS